MALLEPDFDVWESDAAQREQIVKLIRMWAEGKKRPSSGSFVKFHLVKSGAKIAYYPEYL
jgi:hypothetical protein